MHPAGAILLAKHSGYPGPHLKTGEGCRRGYEKETARRHLDCGETGRLYNVVLGKILTGENEDHESDNGPPVSDIAHTVARC